MTKKEIIKGLHEYGEVKCDIMTADALATDGFITNEYYCDGILYGEIDYDAVLRAMFDGDEYEVMQSVADYDSIGWEDLEIATDMYDNGYLTEIGYDGVGNWYCVFNWNDVLTDFCKRCDVFLM